MLSFSLYPQLRQRPCTAVCVCTPAQLPRSPLDLDPYGLVSNVFAGGNWPVYRGCANVKRRLCNRRRAGTLLATPSGSRFSVFAPTAAGLCLLAYVSLCLRTALIGRAPRQKLKVVIIQNLTGAFPLIIDGEHISSRQAYTQSANGIRK